MIKDLPIYPIKLYVYKGLDDTEFFKAMKKDSKNKAPDEFIKEMSNRDSLACTHHWGLNVVMRFKDKRPSVGIIGHECFHALVAIADKIGMRLTDDSDEAYAYLLQELIALTYSDKKK